MELIEIVANANQFLEGYYIFQVFRFIMGVILTVISLDILLLLYILIVKDNYYREFSLGHGVPDIINTMSRRWRNVKKMMNTGGETQQKIAVIEAGDMLYEILNKVGHEGDTLREQLDGMIGEQLENIEDLKKASSIKDSIINDEAYKLSAEVAMETVTAFGAALAEHETIKKVGLKTQQ